MSSIRDGLVSWGKEDNGETSSAGQSKSASSKSPKRHSTKKLPSSTNQQPVPVAADPKYPPGSGDFATKMSRPVRLIAITPTKQSFTSSIGREIWFCSLHAIHHFSMLRTIAVHELVCLDICPNLGHRD